MIATIVIVGAALFWLGVESSWLTIRLAIGESEEDYDRRILAPMLAEPDEIEEWPDSPAALRLNRIPRTPQGMAERLYHQSNKVELLSRFGRETMIQAQAKRFLERG